MPESPGGEFVPLEPPLTPRTPRDDPVRTPRSGFKPSALSPHREQDLADAIPASATRLTPGPVREWVFRDDEVSTDTRSSTTEADAVQESTSSQDEDGEAAKSGRLTLNINLANVLPFSNTVSHATSSEQKPGLRHSTGGAAVNLQMHGIEV